MNRAVAILADPGVLAMLFLAASLVWMVLDQKDKARAVFFLAMLANVFYATVLGQVMGTESALLPWKFDRHLYHIDAALGVSAAAVARALGEPALLRIVYHSMVPVMIWWYAIHRRQGGSALLLAYAAEMVTGPCCYALLPACGPAYAWGAAWLNPADVALVPVRLGYAPNAFPSLHFGTAFVLVIFAAGRLRRAVALLYLAATALATLSTGEHYVIDLVGGIPFACAAAALARKNFKAAAVYIATVLAWLFAIRFATPVMAAHPYLLRVLALATAASGAPAVAAEWRAPGRGSSRVLAVTGS